MKLYGYRKQIQEITKCLDYDAWEIEAIMRDQQSTLDNLDLPSFKRLAKRAAKALEQLRSQNPTWTSGPFFDSHTGKEVPLTIPSV